MKSQFIPITIVDGFFKSPNEIRQKALNFDYGIEGNHPGFRTKNLDLLDENLFKLISNKILSLFLNIEKELATCELKLCFQYTPKQFDFGWAHSDVGTYCAGVIYLTPNPPQDTGTIIFDELLDSKDFKKLSELQDIKKNYYQNRIKHKNYDELRKKNNTLVNKNIVVENIYNRALIYPSNYIHAENNFFGETKENSRLTCVFFLNKVSASGLFPIDRANKINV